MDKDLEIAAQRWILESVAIRDARARVMAALEADGQVAHVSWRMPPSVEDLESEPLRNRIRQIAQELRIDVP